MAQFASREIRIIGISRDSAQSHRDFIANHGLRDITLLTDEGGRIAKLFGTDHALLPVSRRVYMVVDKNRNILYRKDTGFGILPDQTEQLIGVIDERM